MKLHVGHNELRGDLARYAQNFTVAELSSEVGQLPKTRRLHEFREAAPEGFVFSLVLPDVLSEAPDEPLSHPQLKRALEGAQALSAGWLIVPTSPKFRPSPRNEDRLKNLLAALADSGLSVGWEPGSGLWQTPAARRMAASLGVAFVEDVAQLKEAPDASTVYTRLRNIGQASRFGEGAAQQLATQLISCEEAFVLAPPRQAKRIKDLLVQEFTWLAEELSAELDADEEYDDELEDEELDEGPPDSETAADFDSDELEDDELDDDDEAEGKPSGEEEE